MRFFALIATLVLGFGCSSKAQETSPFAQPEEESVSAVLITEYASIQPGGKTRIGVHFEIEEGWHIYAEDPGDAGLPTKVTWSVNDAATIGPVQYPPPQEFLDPGDIRTFGYSGEVVLFSALEAPAQLPDRLAAGLRIAADVRWLACKDVCIPGKVNLELVLPLSPDAPLRSPAADLFPTF